ncbi:MAG: hypothetical protein QNJ68_02725 [Microcoleaceae cyanobacterium MO_207.B10]|nr:hypothetical protein [Microcoleaceae cyanobacterium MO_207.B10]
MKRTSEDVFDTAQKQAKSVGKATQIVMQNTADAVNGQKEFCQF